MSNAALFVEAVDTLTRLGWAALAWIVLCSGMLGLALYAVAVIVWAAARWAWKTARRCHSGPSWARGRSDARRFARTRPSASSGPQQPPWVHTQPIEPTDDYEAAA